MTEARVHVGGKDDPLLVRINGNAPTFKLETNRIETAALAPLAPELIDLLEIAATVFAADGSVPRGGKTRPQMGKGWRRQFTFEIPVRRPDLWSDPDVSAVLKECVGFLTEDDVSFRFLSAPPEPEPREPYFDFRSDRATFPADEVILFSGGLDSFAGALESLRSTSSKIILVSHRSAQKVIPRQVELGRYLTDRFPGRVMHLSVSARRVGQQSRDHDQRSRSLLFAALGQAVAQQFGASRVSFYENGIISHNLPISRQIVGTMATRTTHPLALTLLDRLARLVGPRQIPIENRFQWLTKTEVVRRIAENNAQDQIPRAVSCTSVREQDRLRTHCGACSQCLDRRFAIIAAGLADHDPPEIYQTDVLLGARDTTLSRTMSTEWLRHSMRFASLDEAGLLSIYGQELAWILRGHDDQSRAEVIRRTLDMHRRHSDAVRSALQHVIQDHAVSFADRALPETSLLRLHIGNDAQGSSEITEDPRLARQDVEGERLDADEDEVDDLPPDPDAPLEVDFLVEGGRLVVAVRGLGRVEGRPALVPHALRVPLEEDLASGLTPDECHFRLPGVVPDLMEMNKRTVRSYVDRCRRALAGDYEEIHRRPPPSPLLIQTRRSKGYRLDPTIRILHVAGVE